jgi:hypothetical protein
MERMMKRKLILALIVSMFAENAIAEYAIVVGYDGSGAAQFKSMVTDSATTPIIRAFAQITDGFKSALIGSNADIATQMEQRQVDAIKAQKRYENMKNQQPAIDACGGQSMAGYAQSVVDISRSISSAAKARAAAAAGNAPSIPEQQALVDDIHHHTYCNPDTDPEKCKNGRTEKNEKGEDMMDADKSSESLFSGAGVPGRTEDLTFTPKQLEAAEKYIKNVIDSADTPRKLTPSEYDTAEGKKYEGLRTVYESRMSLARNVLIDIKSQRTPMKDSSEILDAIRDGSPVGGAGYINNRVARLLGWDPDGNISPLELMDIDIRRRVDNPAWYEAINTSADQVSLLREQTFMLAMLLKMQYMQMRQHEVTAALEATSSAESTKANMKPKLDEAEKAINRGASK